MHVVNIETLRDEAQRLLDLVISKIEEMRGEDLVVTDGKGQTFDKSSISKEIEILEGEQEKLKSFEMVLAVVGTMKAGKSTTINAIVGAEVLPNRNRPMTALPTLIRHTPGQIEPVLKFENNKPANDHINNLRAAISTSEGAARLDNIERNPDMDDLIEMIRLGKHFEKSYHGENGIFWFLKSLNDLVRLSKELKVDFPFGSYDEIREIPQIDVEFCHLSEMDSSSGSLVLLDTPGPNESGQEHLKSMLKEQLGKASAVLAVLDYTQLKSEADAQVRSDLQEISDVAKGRMYALVNKFDMADRHGDREDAVGELVSGTLLRGIVEKKSVFPISSKMAYLANRARHELSLKGVISNTDPWVADFGKEAFGRFWEADISDVDRVRLAINALWEASLFGAPLESVIKSAHAQAAAYAVDAAASKLFDVAQRLNDFLGNRENALNKDVEVLQRLIQGLKLDIDQISRSEVEAGDRIRRSLTDFEERVQRDLNEIQNIVLDKIEGYFKEGREIERRDAVAESRAISNHAWQQNFNLFKPTFVGRLKNLLGGSDGGGSESRDREQHFSPDEKVISFRKKDDATALVEKINRTVSLTIDDANRVVKEVLIEAADDFQKGFYEKVVRDAELILENMKSRLGDEDISLNFKVPSAGDLALKGGSEAVIGTFVDEKTREETRHRRKDGVWGTICGWFGTNDWGWESYQESVSFFEVDIIKIRSGVEGRISGYFKGLNSDVSMHFDKSLKKGVDDFFYSFKEKVESVRADLNQSILDHELKKDEQLNLAKSLSLLRMNVPEALQDSAALKEQVGPVLKYGVEK